jgi:UDP-N-acetylglucosamine acyltransferase
MRELIHPTAIVSSKARIGDNVRIGAYSIIEDDVEIGDNTIIRSSVVLANGARIGKDVEIYTGAVIATEPQDLKFKDEVTYVDIGDRTIIREYTTINRATSTTKHTIVGQDCLIMTYSHIGHDSHIGNNIIMSNSVQLAGHVTIEDWVTIGGVVKIHQFSMVGCHSMISADLKVVKDIPPYTTVGREPGKVEGLNKIGLKRRGFSNETINEIEEFYNMILHSGLNVTAGIKKYMERGIIIAEVQHCIDFINKSKRGIYR